MKCEKYCNIICNMLTRCLPKNVPHLPVLPLSVLFRCLSLLFLFFFVMFYFVLFPYCSFFKLLF